MINQKSTPDPELLNQIAQQYEISKKFLGTVEGFSPLEAEVNRSLCALVCVIDGYDYFTVSSRFNECFPVVEDYAKRIGLPVYSNADGYKEWEKKTFYEISTDIQSVANDLCAATKVTFTPNKDEFVLLLSVDKYQYLSQKAPLTGTVREYIKSRFPKCSLMVYPSVCQNNKELIAITKVDGKYFCARRYGI